MQYTRNFIKNDLNNAGNINNAKSIEEFDSYIKIKYLINKLKVPNLSIYNVPSKPDWKMSRRQEHVIQLLKDTVEYIKNKKWRTCDFTDAYWFVWDYFNDYENKEDIICKEEFDVILPVITELYRVYNYELMKSKLNLYQINTDFYIEIIGGAVLAPTHPAYEKSKKSIVIDRSLIYDDKSNKPLNKYYSSINLYGEKYVLTDKKIDKIEKLVNQNLSKFIEYSILQNPDYIVKHGIEGVDTNIFIKIGGLSVSLNALYLEFKYKKHCQDFIEKVIEIIVGG